MRKAPGRRRGGGKTSRTVFVIWALLSLLSVELLANVAGWRAVERAFADVPVTVGGKAVVSNTDGDPIRIRKGPSTEHAQIASAREGQTVNVLEGPTTDGVGIRWFKIEATAATGWMMAQYLRGVAPPETPSATTLIGSARVANTDGDRLRVRSAPSTTGDVIAYLAPGTIVTIEAGPVTDDTGIVWYRITSGRFTGWAMARYLAQAEAAPPPGGGSAAPPEAEPVTSTPPATTSPSSSRSQYRQWMEEARAMYPYPQSIDKMWSVMMCESGGNPNASGGGGRWLGLFQYAPGTWRGSWNPYRAESIWDARAQIFATAKAWSIGMQHHWSCF